LQAKKELLSVIAVRKGGVLNYTNDWIRAALD